MADEFGDCRFRFAGLCFHDLDEFADERSSRLVSEHGSEDVLSDVAGAEADHVERGAEVHAGDLGAFVVGCAEEKVQLDGVGHCARSLRACSRTGHEVFGDPCTDHLEWCVRLVEIGSERDVVQDRANEQQFGVGRLPAASRSATPK